MVQAWIVEGLIIIFIGAFVVAAFIKLVTAVLLEVAGTAPNVVTTVPICDFSQDMPFLVNTRGRYKSEPSGLGKSIQPATPLLSMSAFV